eukprot:Polyplicarium_translucidae@DN3367_c0_g1_i22.p1
MTYYTGRIPAPEMAKWSSVWDIDRNGTAYHWRLPEPNPLLPVTTGLRPPLDMGDTSPDTKRLSSVTLRDVNPRWIDDVAGTMPNVNLSRHFFLREEGRAFVGQYFASPVDRTPYGFVEIETATRQLNVPHAVLAAGYEVERAGRRHHRELDRWRDETNLRMHAFWPYATVINRAYVQGYSDKWPLAFDMAVEAQATTIANLTNPETSAEIEGSLEQGSKRTSGLYGDWPEIVLHVLRHGRDEWFALWHAVRHLDANAVAEIIEDEALPSPTTHSIWSKGDTKADELVALVRRVSPYLPRTPSYARHTGPMRRRRRFLLPLEVPLMDRIDNQLFMRMSRLQIIHQVPCSKSDLLCKALRHMVARFIVEGGGPPLPDGMDWMGPGNRIGFRSSSTNPHEMLQKIVDWKASVRDHINATVIEMKARRLQEPEEIPTGAYEQQRLAWGLNPEARGRIRSLARAGAINPES